MGKSDVMKEYLRKKNTYHYSVHNIDGIEGKVQTGDFNIRIPPMPFPEHQSSQYCLFKLDSMYVINQTRGAGQEDMTQQRRLSRSVEHDLSGFYVEINGLGIQPVIATIPGTTARPSGNSFFILNETAMADLDKSFQYSTNSGGHYHGDSVVCSNPVGAVMNVKIRDAFSANILTDNGNLITVLNFSIEVLDVDAC